MWTHTGEEATCSWSEKRPAKEGPGLPATTGSHERGNEGTFPDSLREQAGTDFRLLASRTGSEHTSARWPRSVWHSVAAASQSDAHPSSPALRSALNEKGERAKRGEANAMQGGLLLMPGVIVSIVINEHASGIS